MNIQPVSLSLTEQAKWLKLLQPDAELISPADPRLQNPPSDRNTPLKKKQMRAFWIMPVSLKPVVKTLQLEPAPFVLSEFHQAFSITHAQKKFLLILLNNRYRADDLNTAIQLLSICNRCYALLGMALIDFSATQPKVLNYQPFIQEMSQSGHLPNAQIGPTTMLEFQTTHRTEEGRKHLIFHVDPLKFTVMTTKKDTP